MIGTACFALIGSLWYNHSKIRDSFEEITMAERKRKLPTRKPIELPVEYQYGPERKVVSLEKDGILCVPVLGFDDFRSPVTASPLHSHKECIEISYCVRGDLTFELAGREHAFRPGEVFVTLPDEEHRLSTWPHGISKYWILFRVPKKGFPCLHLSPKEVRWLVDALQHLPRRSFEDVSGVRETFRRIFHLYETLAKGTPERTLRLRTAVADLLLAIVDSANSAPRVHPDLKLRAIAEEMRDHPERPFDFQGMADGCGMSRSSFEVRFKKSLGYSPRAYLIRCRIEAAKILLEQGKSVGYVANRFGYSAPRHFSTQFKAVTGQTPRQIVRSAKSLIR